MSEPLMFTVYGKAQAAGSKRAFVNKSTGRHMIVDANKNSRPWKALVSDAAVIAMLSFAHTENGTLVDAPLFAIFAFYVPRPKSHYGAHGLKESAPDYPTKRPDVLKLARGVEDAMTGIVYRDDSQIVKEWISKSYGEPERVEVILRLLEDADG